MRQLRRLLPPLQRRAQRLGTAAPALRLQLPRSRRPSQRRRRMRSWSRGRRLLQLPPPAAAAPPAAPTTTAAAAAPSPPSPAPEAAGWAWAQEQEPAARGEKRTPSDRAPAGTLAPRRRRSQPPAQQPPPPPPRTQQAAVAQAQQLQRARTQQRAAEGAAAAVAALLHRAQPAQQPRTRPAAPQPRRTARWREEAATRCRSAALAAWPQETLTTGCALARRRPAATPPGSTRRSGADTLRAPRRVRA